MNNTKYNNLDITYFVFFISIIFILGFGLFVIFSHILEFKLIKTASTPDIQTMSHTFLYKFQILDYLTFKDLISPDRNIQIDTIMYFLSALCLPFCIILSRRYFLLYKKSYQQTDLSTDHFRRSILIVNICTIIYLLIILCITISAIPINVVELR